MLRHINETAKQDAQRSRVVQLQQVVLPINTAARRRANAAAEGASGIATAETPWPFSLWEQIRDLPDTDWNGRRILQSLVAPHRIVLRESWPPSPVAVPSAAAQRGFIGELVLGQMYNARLRRLVGVARRVPRALILLTDMLLKCTGSSGGAAGGEQSQVYLCGALDLETRVASDSGVELHYMDSRALEADFLSIAWHSYEAEYGHQLGECGVSGGGELARQHAAAQPLGPSASALLLDADGGRIDPLERDFAASGARSEELTAMEKARWEREKERRLEELHQAAGEWTTRLRVKEGGGGGMFPSCCWYLCFGSARAQVEWTEALRKWVEDARLTAQRHDAADAAAWLGCRVLQDQDGDGDMPSPLPFALTDDGVAVDAPLTAAKTLSRTNRGQAGMCGWLRYENVAVAGGWHTLWFEIHNGWLGGYNTPGSRRLAMVAQAEAVFAVDLRHVAIRHSPKRARKSAPSCFRLDVLDLAAATRSNNAPMTFSKLVLDGGDDAATKEQWIKGLTEAGAHLVSTS